MRHRTQGVAYAYFVVALLLYGLQMVFGLLAISEVPRARSDPRLAPVRPRQGDPYQSPHRVGAHRLHGSHVLGRPRGIARGTVLAQTGLLVARPLDAGRRHGRGRLHLRLDRGEQAPRTTLPGEACDRRGHAPLPVQHRDDHQRIPDDSRPPKACSLPDSRSPRCSTCRHC